MNKNNIKPCKYCLNAIGDCKTREKLMAAIGLIKEIAAITIKCTDYYSQFEPGDRVILTYCASDYDKCGNGENLEYWPGEEVAGTVFAWSKRTKKVGVFLDEEICIHAKNRRVVFLYPKYPIKGDYAQSIKKTRRLPESEIKAAVEAANAFFENSMGE